MKIAVTGSSGLIGSALIPVLEAGGHSVVRVVRNAGGPSDCRWDPATGTIDAAALDGVDGVVHLAGAGIGDHRWSDDYKREVLESRTKGTTLIASTIAALEHRPTVLVSGSAIGYYGDRGDELLDESSAPGKGFLTEVCEQWEAASKPASDAGIRVATIRTGIVLSKRGGALKKMLPLFRFGLGGRFGSGRQWQSWISIDDEVGAIRHLLTNDVEGPVNLTAPNPVTNKEFSQTLARVLHRPSFLPVPSFGPKLLVGPEAADALLFDGQRVLPAVLEKSGYEFTHPRLEAALQSLLA